MYGKESDKVSDKLEKLEREGKEDTAEYKALVEKFNKLRKKELREFNKNWRNNNDKNPKRSGFGIW